jgi:hypothetical protein
MRVQVYKNLRNGKWSITSGEKIRSKGKLIGHADEVILSDCEFYVSEKSRQWVINHKERQVHAWIVGTICDDVLAGDKVPVTYNPFRSGSFTVRVTGEAIQFAKAVHFTKDQGAIAIL